MFPEIEQLSHFVDNMPAWKGHNRPKRVPVDEKAASAPYTPPPQGDPQAPLKFSIPPMLEAGFFAPMTPKAFQAFTNYWYA